MRLPYRGHSAVSMTAVDTSKIWIHSPEMIHYSCLPPYAANSGVWINGRFYRIWRSTEIMLIYVEYSSVSTINFNTFHLKAVKLLPLLYVWITLEGPYLHFFSSIRHGKYRNFMHPTLRHHFKFTQATEYIQWKPAPIFCVNKMQIKTILLAPSLKSGKISWQELRVIFSMPSSPSWQIARKKMSCS